MTMTQVRIAGPYQSPPLQLLAEGARIAYRDSSCCLCPRPVRPGSASLMSSAAAGPRTSAAATW